MFSSSLIGTTVRDLVFLVQDGGIDAAAAEAQLLSSHERLIKSAARRHPQLHSAVSIAREAFIEAVHQFRFATNDSVTTYCWARMCKALDAAAENAQHEQLALFNDPVPAPFRVSDLKMLRRIALADAARIGMVLTKPVRLHLSA